MTRSGKDGHLSHLALNGRLIAPLSQKRYIKNETLQMFVVLQDDRINITNHIYNYDITVPSIMTQKLNRMFKIKLPYHKFVIMIID